MILVPVLVLVLSQIQASVAAAAAASAPPAPGSVELKDGLLRWAPATDDATHAVQFQAFDEDGWRSLAECEGTAESECDVRALLRSAKHGCVRLRVRAQRGPLASEAVEACGASGDRCTPELGLSPAGVSLTVNLSRRHSLLEALGRHARYNVCHWSADAPRRLCHETRDALPLPDLEPGRTFCAAAQFLYFDRAEGVGRCPVCRDVPRHPSPYATVVVSVVLALIALGLSSLAAYVLIYHRNKIKTWCRPEPEPDSLTLPLGGASVCTTPEEPCSIITGFRPIQED